MVARRARATHGKSRNFAKISSGGGACLHRDRNGAPATYSDKTRHTSRAGWKNMAAQAMGRAMYSFMIVCPNCGAVGSAAYEGADIPKGPGWSLSILRLSREFFRRVAINGDLETVCDGCRTVVELHGTSTWLRRARPAGDLRK